ncbi:hypothetical protein [Neotabrizicola sp. sgz301269]|uniref:hypothetical protein n=1 Tax=Neotabrizicola sp. sgz301269 TaxID=3276282 RepID=UPI00377029CE
MTIRFSDGEDGSDKAGGAQGAAASEGLDPFAEDVLAFTEALFRVAQDDLNSALGAIREGRFEAAKAGKVAAHDLAEMGRQVLEGRRNVDKLRKQIAGAVGTWGELDLDQARDEIGRRLACLRDARGD